jgi:hypothetical protein
MAPVKTTLALTIVASMALPENSKGHCGHQQTSSKQCPTVLHGWSSSY